MQYQVKLNAIDDADEYFLVAKDRLLDVNEWNTINNSTSSFMLTDTHGHKLHREAHIGDMIKAHFVLNDGVEKDRWLLVEKIQYDSFPDMNGEQISMNLRLTYSPSGNGISLSKYTEEQQKLKVILNRTNTLVSISSKSAKVNSFFDMDSEQLNSLLKGMITLKESA